MHIPRIICFFLIVICQITSCSGQKPVHEKFQSERQILSETATHVQFREAGGKIVDLPKHPRRTIVCLNSILDAWYMAGGVSLARVRGSVNVPEKAKDLPVLGSINNLNMELIMEIEPDFLIVSYSDYQRKVRDFFVSEGVPGVSIHYATYEDFRVILDLFTRLTGMRDIYEQVVIPVEKKVRSIVGQVPVCKDPPGICILFASPRYVKVETRNTITGYFCETLGAENIYKETRINGADRVDLSLEYIMEQDPDVIFVTTMGNTEKCKARMEMDVINSDVWGSLSAVKNNRFIYLDTSYSIYKPNRFYPEAFKTIAEYIYPGTRFVLDK
jgi:iron complex transport system substrate-binding protein